MKSIRFILSLFTLFTSFVSHADIYYGNCESEGAVSSTRLIAKTVTTYRALICKDREWKSMSEEEFSMLINGYYSNHKDQFDALAARFLDPTTPPPRHSFRYRPVDADKVDEMVKEVGKFMTVRFVVKGAANSKAVEPVDATAGSGR